MNKIIEDTITQQTARIDFITERLNLQLIELKGILKRSENCLDQNDLYATADYFKQLSFAAQEIIPLIMQMAEVKEQREQLKFRAQNQS